MTSLKHKTILGVLWNGIEKFTTLFVQLVCTLMIAVVLTPRDFGIIGMLTVFIALGNVIIDSGFSQALIREKQTIKEDFSSIFYFNIFISILIYATLFIVSPYIAVFYNMPELEKVAKVSFLALPINAFSIIQLTLFQKRLDFKSSSRVSVISSILSGILGVVLAYVLESVWALVWQILFFSLFKTILFWLISPWRPILKFSFEPIRRLGKFSVNLLFSGITSVVFDNLYTILIGKYYKASDLGLYTQAKKMADIPSLSITTVIQQVTYSSLSTFIDDRIKLRDNYRKIIRLAVYIVCPVMGYLIVMAPTLFNYILGEKWQGSIVYFQLLCIIGMSYPISSINLNILKVVGKSNLLLKIEIGKKILLTLILLLTININLMAVVYGNIVYAFITVLLNLYFCGKQIDLKVSTQIKDVGAIYLLTLFTMGVVFYITNNVLIESPLILLLFCFFVMVTLWFGISYFFKYKALRELIKIKDALR